jgi:hypothetical protein
MVAKMRGIEPKEMICCLEERLPYRLVGCEIRVSVLGHSQPS